MAENQFKTDEQKRFAEFDKNWSLTRQIFNHIKSNALGQPKGAWVDPDRPSGQEQPGIYGVPENEMLLGEVDTFHGGGLMKKFKMSKVGSGEGRQYFGWGGYFSTQKGVGENYYRQYIYKHGKTRAKITPFDKEKFRELIKDEIKDILTPKQADEFLKFEAFKTREQWLAERVERLETLRYTEPKSALRRSIKEYIGDAFREARRDKWISKHAKPGKNLGGLGFSKELGFAKQAELEVDVPDRIAERLSRKLIKTKKTAGLYKAKLWEGHQESLMDWDKPVSKDNAEKITYGLIYDLLEKRKTPVKQKYLDQQIKMFIGRFSTRGEIVYKDLAKKFGSDKAASKFLESVGIDGIRYPVGTLSGGGTGYNYVVFDEEAINLQRIK